MADVIRAAKNGVGFSSWSDEKLRTKDFPLNKKRGKVYPLTRRYRWQIVTFTIHNRAYRVLIAHHTLLPEFIATLAEDVGGDCRVLARWEFHGSHGGWHVHSVCGDTDSLQCGLVKPTGTTRIPDKASYHRHTKLLNDGCDMEDAVATAIACSLVGIPHQPDMFVKNAVPWS